MNQKKICLLTKDNKTCDMAVDFVKRNFVNFRIIKGNLKSPGNNWIFDTQFDYLIAFLYHNLVPENVLKNTRIAAINFHPAPPEYRGAGSYSYAIYNGDEAYGTTCHHMVKKADSGEIIAVKRFPVFKTDTFESIKERTMLYTILNFLEVMFVILRDQMLPLSSEHWGTKVHTQKEFERELLEIDPILPPEEIDKRIRATAHPIYPGPYLLVNGKRYTIRSVESAQPFEFGECK